VATGAPPLARGGPPELTPPGAQTNMYLGALGEMPTVAGAPDSLAFLIGHPAPVRAALSDAVWSSREASRESFVFAGSRWRSAIVRAVGLLAVAALLTWIVTLGLGLRTTPTTVPTPSVEAHPAHR